MNRIKRFLLVLVTICLLSGCVKNNITTTINKDKSMNLEVEVFVRDESKELLDSKIDITDLESRGFKIASISQGDSGYIGYRISKKFDSIDKLSNGNKNTVDITDILEKNFEFEKLFVKQSTFFKDTYTANLVYSADKLKNRYSLYGYSGEEIPEEVELKYTLVIPNKVIQNDADDISVDKKYLTWNLSTTEDSKINYTFEIINTTHIILLGAGAVILVILIIVLLIVLKKKKASKATLIYKEYDPSIEGQLNKNEVIEGEATKVEGADQGVNPENVVQTGELPNQPDAPEIPVAQAPVAPVETAPSETPVEAPQEVAPVEPSEPAVETAVDNMEMQSLPSLEFEVPSEVIEQQEKEAKEKEEQEEIEIKRNTWDYHRRPDFIKSNEPGKFVEEEDKKEEAPEVVEPETKKEIDLPVMAKSEERPAPKIDEPHFVEQQEVDNSGQFLVSDKTMFRTEENAPKKASMQELDVPDAIAFSDMPDK